MSSADPELARRAEARRRRGMSGDVIAPGDPEPDLYAGLSPVERWAALSELNERLARVAGEARPIPPRHEWPGEVFRLPWASKD
ncbi:MAG: hypothetical protein AAF447_10440 [Myxococcota bacterium]